MFPQALVDRYHQARTLYDKGKVAQALALLDDIERKAPNHPEIMHARAICLHALDRDDEALPLCNKMFTMHGDRRGLELRTQWKVQNRSPIQDRFGGMDALNAPLENASHHRAYIITGVLVLAFLTFLMLVIQFRTPPPETPLPRAPANVRAIPREIPQNLKGGVSTPIPTAEVTSPDGEGETPREDAAVLMTAPAAPDGTL